jgi:hypothetical protein
MTNNYKALVKKDGRVEDRLVGVNCQEAIREGLLEFAGDFERGTGIQLHLGSYSPNLKVFRLQSNQNKMSLHPTVQFNRTL